MLRHAESLDTKAGVILGFAGVVVALRGLGRTSWWTVPGLVLTIGSALLAVLAFAPRSFPVLEVRNLRDDYLRSEPEFTQLCCCS
jgi:drug/metabolite transporter (DMT)-like permease